jgi:hypothetical protein
VVLWLPLFVVLGGVSFWVYGVFDGRIAAMRDAREPAYTASIGGCSAGARARVPAIEGADLGVVLRLADLPGADIVDRALTSTTQNATFTYVAAGLVAVFGLRSNEISARVVISCNEPVRDGDPRGMKHVSSSSFDPRSP